MTARLHPGITCRCQACMDSVRPDTDTALVRLAAQFARGKGRNVIRRTDMSRAERELGTTLDMGADRK